MNYINPLLIIASWLAVVFGLALCSKTYFPNTKELTRKIVHIGTGPIIPLAWWLNIPGNIAIPVALVITISLTINYRFRWINAIEDIQRHSYGTIAYALSITILFILLWSKNASAVCAGILVMSFGDGLAGLVGRALKSPSWMIWGQKKSLAGSVTMGISAFIVLTLIAHFIQVPINPLKILAISSLAVVLEQISRWGIDNITVPIGVAYCWVWITNSIA